jgi:DNA-binding transcriptional regulator YdaS (Cro superfamily)
MKRVRIDFAPRSIRRTLFHASPGAWAMAFAAVALLVPAASHGWNYLANQRQLEVQLAAARAHVHPTPLSQAALRQPPVSPKQAEAINSAVLQLNLPWRALRDAVQEATPANVALLALEPDAKKRIVHITAEARTSEEMIGYVERMKRQDRFVGVVLVRHEINEQDPIRPIRFQLDAQWEQQQ